MTELGQMIWDDALAQGLAEDRHRGLPKDLHKGRPRDNSRLRSATVN